MSMSETLQAAKSPRNFRDAKSFRDAKQTTPWPLLLNAAEDRDPPLSLVRRVALSLSSNAYNASLGRLLGVSRVTARHYLKGERSVPAQRWRLMASRLRANANVLASFAYEIDAHVKHVDQRKARGRVGRPRQS